MMEKSWKLNPQHVLKTTFILAEEENAPTATKRRWLQFRQIAPTPSATPPPGDI
jgi:hypothetical protein